MSDIQLQVIARSDVLARRRPDLAGWSVLLREAAGLLREAEAHVEPMDLPQQFQHDKLIAGAPVLVNEDLPIDIALHEQVFDALVLNTLARLQPAASPSKRAGLLSSLMGKDKPATTSAEPTPAHQEMSKQLAAVILARKTGRLALDSLWAAKLTGSNASVHAGFEAVSCDPALGAALTELSLAPAFRTWSRLVTVDGDIWQRGQCPVCGSLALFSEIKGREALRMLRCGLCAFAWNYDRLTCRHCGENDTRKLGRLSTEMEEEKYFAQTCDSCKRYDKFINNFDEIAPELLHIENLLASHYDGFAGEQGYCSA